MRALHILQGHTMKYKDLEEMLLADFTLNSEDSRRCGRKIVERHIGELVYKGALVLNFGNGNNK